MPVGMATGPPLSKALTHEETTGKEPLQVIPGRRHHPPGGIAFGEREQPGGGGGRRVRPDMLQGSGVMTSGELAIVGPRGDARGPGPAERGPRASPPGNRTGPSGSG